MDTRGHDPSRNVWAREAPADTSICCLMPTPHHTSIPSSIGDSCTTASTPAVACMLVVARAQWSVSRLDRLTSACTRQRTDGQSCQIRVAPADACAWSWHGVDMRIAPLWSAMHLSALACMHVGCTRRTAHVQTLVKQFPSDRSTSDGRQVCAHCCIG